MYQRLQDSSLKECTGKQNQIGHSSMLAQHFASSCFAVGESTNFGKRGIQTSDIRIERRLVGYAKVGTIQLESYGINSAIEPLEDRVQ